MRALRLLLLGGSQRGPRITISGLTVSEDASVGDDIGTLSVVGATGTPSFTLEDDAGGLFALDGDVLEVAGALDYETATSHQIEVSVSGMTPQPPNKVFTVTVTDVMEPTDTEITQDGIAAVFTGVFETGQWVGGDYWIEAVGNEVILSADTGLASGLGSHTYFGGVMVDPADDAVQGFDDRGSMAATYDGDLAESLPLTVDVSGGPKTIWLYRGRDTQEGGGGNSMCYAILRITVVQSAPAANALAPNPYAGDKTIYTQDDIDYDLFTPISVPIGAVEPDWDDDFYLSRPFVSGLGLNFQTQFMAPTLYQKSYPLTMAEYLGPMLLGALSDTADRTSIIDRLVTAGIEIKGRAELGGNPWFSKGDGYGVLMKGVMFFAGQWLDEVDMITRPASTHQSGGVDQAFFQEDGIYSDGDTRILYGINHDGAVNYTGNHEYRDLAGVYDPHNYPVLTGTAQAGSSNTIQLAAGTPDEIENGYLIIIDSGTGAGQFRIVSGWDNSTKTVTVSVNWTTPPDNTSVYRYANGGAYQSTASAAYVVEATALVIAHENNTGGRDIMDDWDNPIFFAGTQQWVEDDGELTDPFDPTGINSDREFRCFYDADEEWSALFYDVAEPDWPVYVPPSEGEWVTVYTWPTGGGVADDNGYNGLTLVGTIPLADFSATSGTHIRFTFDGATTEGFVASAMWIGNGGGAEVWDFNDDPGTGEEHVQVTMGAGNTITVGAGASDVVTDDTVAFVKDGTNPFVYALQFQSGAADNLKRTSSGQDENSYFKSGADAATQNKSGYSNNLTASYIKKIEIFVP